MQGTGETRKYFLKIFTRKFPGGCLLPGADLNMGMDETPARKPYPWVYAYHGSGYDHVDLRPHQGEEGGLSLSFSEDVAACYGSFLHRYDLSKANLYPMSIADWLSDKEPTEEIKKRGFDGIRVIGDPSYGISGGSEPEDRTFHHDMAVVWNIDKMWHNRVLQLPEPRYFESLPLPTAPPSCRLSLEQLHALSRANMPKEEFQAWMDDLYDVPAERDVVLASEAMRLDSYYDFLQEKHSLRVREDGQWEIYELTPKVESILGPDAQVVLYHMTSDKVVPQIARIGLRGTEHDVSRLGESQEGVFLSSVGSGSAMDTYARAAERVHGGEAVLLEVAVRLGDLRPDPHDEDIQSGRNQFVISYVPPAHILNLSELMESKLPDVPSLRKVAGDDKTDRDAGRGIR